MNWKNGQLDEICKAEGHEMPVLRLPVNIMFKEWNAYSEAKYYIRTRMTWNSFSSNEAKYYIQPRRAWNACSEGKKYVYMFWNRMAWNACSEGKNYIK